MAEDLQNPDNVQAAAGNPAADGEEYEYEYIELAEGEELPEDAEYEYVEVSDDEMPSMIPPTAVVSTSDVSQPEVSTPEPIIPSAPETVAEPASSAPVQSVDAVVPQAAVSQPVSVPPVEEADLNALLDNDGEIEEVDASTLLDGDYSDDFARNLFADKPSEKIEEVSIDDILGEDAAAVPAGIGDVREVSADELIAGIRNKEDDDGSLRRNIWSDLTDDVPAAAKPEPVVEPEPVVAPEPVVEPEPVVAPEPVVPVFEETEPDVYAPVTKMTSEPEVAEAVEPAAEENTEQEQVRPDESVSETEIRSETVMGRVVQVAYQSVLLTDDVRTEMLAKDRVADENSGLQFFEMRGGGLLLNVSEVSALENWHLIIFNQNLVPAEAGGTIEIVQPQDTIRAATVVKQGTEKLEIYNEEEYRFADPADGFVPARKHFIYGRTDDDTGLIVNDFVNIGLRANAGKVITFENPVFGWLSGPNGAQIYFAQLGRLAVSSPEQAAGDDEKAGQHAAKWYSGNLEDRYFEFSGASQSGEFTGSDEVKNIHVNVGTSAYGWNVSFDNGLVMSMRDLQEFESKHGKMPSPNGEISHGALKLKFSNVERIVAYQTPQYFAYGRR